MGKKDATECHVCQRGSPIGHITGSLARFTIPILIGQ